MKVSVHESSAGRIESGYKVASGGDLQRAPTTLIGLWSPGKEPQEPRNGPSGTSSAHKSLSMERALEHCLIVSLRAHHMPLPNSASNKSRLRAIMGLLTRLGHFHNKEVKCQVTCDIRGEVTCACLLSSGEVEAVRALEVCRPAYLGYSDPSEEPVSKNKIDGT